MADFGGARWLSLLLLASFLRLADSQVTCRISVNATLGPWRECKCHWSCDNAGCNKDGVCFCDDGHATGAPVAYVCTSRNCPSTVWADNAHCGAQCDSLCTNGRCDDRGTYCTCYDGFRKAPNRTDYGYCKTQCDARCKNGRCDNGGTCTCSDGYKKSPQKLDQCDKISCPSEGKDDKTYCASKCRQDCHNGECKNGVNCVCNSGFKKSTQKTYQCDQIKCPSLGEDDAFCKAQCETSCKNGSCEVQGHCECNNGFTKLQGEQYKCANIKCPSTTAKDAKEMKFCKTFCESQCNNGVCDEVGDCKCNAGFKKLHGDSYQCSQVECPASSSEDSAFCLRLCQITCTNGECSEEGACVCHQGFVSTNASTNASCHHECNKDGTCDSQLWVWIVGGGSAAIVVAISVLTVVVWKRNRKDRAKMEQESLRLSPNNDPGTNVSPRGRNCETYLEPRRVLRETKVEYHHYETVAEVVPSVGASVGSPATRLPSYMQFTDSPTVPAETPVYLNVQPEQRVHSYANFSTGNKWFRKFDV